MKQAPNEIATVGEVAEWLRMTPRVVRKRWRELGGWIIGGQYRASWSRIMEVLNSANEVEEEGRPVASPRVCERTSSGVKAVSARAQEWPGVESGQRVGGGSQSGGPGRGKSKLGLREFRPMAQAVSGPRMAHDVREDSQRESGGA